MAGNRRANNYAGGGMRPPMIPPSLNNSNADALNTSVLSGGGGPNGATPKSNSNYRKAFKPNLPPSGGM